MISCDYKGDPFDGYGPCVGRETVPAGCPIDFVTPTEATAVMVSVSDAQGSVVTRPGTTQLVSIVQGTGSSIDLDSCDCASISGPMTLDRYEAQLATREGDLVAISTGTGSDIYGHVSITAPAPCPAAAWPTAYSWRTACDLCDADPPQHDGCAAGHGDGIALVFLVLLVWRRRSAR